LYILYTKPGCHLCDEACELLVLAAGGIAVTEVDINSDGELVRRYGLRIPVLADPDSGRELEWPFGPEDVRRFLTAREDVEDR
jgi:hypothetical protein